MIVMSVKWTVKKIIIAAVAVVLAICLAVLGINMLGSDKGSAKKVVRNLDERVKFLCDLGWEVDPKSEAVKDIVIPETFDELFVSFNALQKAAGYDLEPHKGASVKRYTYQILNYPSAEKGDIIKADLIVLNDEIIGGDIYSLRLDGFMTGLINIKDVQK